MSSLFKTPIPLVNHSSQSSADEDQHKFIYKQRASTTQFHKSLEEEDVDKRWQELARQIKGLKRKIRKMNESMAQDELKEGDKKEDYQIAQDVINRECGEFCPPDHKDLIRNLSKAIAEDRLLPESDAYSRICNIVRDCIPVHILQSVYKELNLNELIRPRIFVVNDNYIPIIQFTNDCWQNEKDQEMHMMTFPRNSNDFDIYQEFCQCSHSNPECGIFSEQEKEIRYRNCGSFHSLQLTDISSINTPTLIPTLNNLCSSLNNNFS